MYSHFYGATPTELVDLAAFSKSSLVFFKVLRVYRFHHRGLKSSAKVQQKMQIHKKNQENFDFYTIFLFLSPYNARQIPPGRLRTIPSISSIISSDAIVLYGNCISITS